MILRQKIKMSHDFIALKIFLESYGTFLWANGRQGKTFFEYNIDEINQLLFKTIYLHYESWAETK